MSRRGKSSAPPITLFSFQDIITCITGILILVTLLLVLELLTRVEVQQEPAPSPAEIADLQGNIDSVKQQHRRISEETRRLETMLSELGGTSPIAPETELRSAEAAFASKQHALDEVTAQASRAAASREAAAADARRLQAEAEQAGAKAKASSDAVAAAARMNARFLLPGKGSTKTPLLVECVGKDVKVGAIAGDGQLQTLQAWNGWRAGSSLLEWADGRSSAADFFVVMVRPDAVGAAEQIIKALRDKGFDVGWDAVPAADKLFAK